jgi:hypothetical protein
MMLASSQHAGDVEYDVDRYDAAYKAVERPLELAKEAVEHTDSVGVRHAYILLLAHAVQYEALVNTPEALARGLELGHRALDLAQALHARIPDNASYYGDVGTVQDRLGSTYSQLHQYDRAVDAHRPFLAVEQELLRRDPGNPTIEVAIASATTRSASRSRTCPVTVARR